MKTKGDCLVTSEMLFQDFASAYLTDLKPNCNVLLRDINISPFVSLPCTLNCSQGFKKIMKK